MSEAVAIPPYETCRTDFNKSFEIFNTSRKLMNNDNVNIFVSILDEIISLNLICI
jgi:hypothetical protein